MSILDVMPPPVAKWGKRQKEALVLAVARKEIETETAVKLYGLSAEEFKSWQDLHKRHGADGLMATHVKRYRERRDV